MTAIDVGAFWAEYGESLLLRLGEHIFLTFTSVFLAGVIGILLGMAAFRWHRIRQPLLSVVNIIQTVPSLAMLALLLALMQRIGALPALIALTLYGLLPVVRGTLVGLQSIPPTLIEVARGIGMTQWQRMRLVRLPLAMPQIISSLRVAANIGVGIATVAAFIGAGGLGQFINRGLFLSDTKLILLGAIPAALLAVLLDQLIAAIEREWFSPPSSESRQRAIDPLKRLILMVLPLAIFAAGTYWAYGIHETRNAGKVVIGSKSFSEQFILGEIMAQAIERETPLEVERRFGLGGSLVLHQAILAGEIDLYPEYTGTAITAVLKEKDVRAVDVYPLMREIYRQRYALQVFPPFGFNNSYVFVMQAQMAEALKISRLSDLKESGRKLRAAVDFEFAAREDGLIGLQKAYNIRFGSVRDIDPNIIYSVLERGQADIISGYNTDGRIEAFGFRALKDDLDFFPPYHAVIVARQDILKRYPSLKPVLDKLSGTLDDMEMRRLNYEVDQNKRDAAEVAAEFLDSLQHAR